MTTRSSWASVVDGVLDDDQRTRRADVLLSHITVWLIVLGSVAVVLAQLLLATPWWVPTSAGGFGAASAVLTVLRRRRVLASAGGHPSSRTAEDQRR